MIVLIVDDQPSMVELWERYFKPVAKDIRKAHNIPDARTLMRQRPSPDLVLLDLKLSQDDDPRDTLLEIEHFKSVNPDVLVLVVTGMPDDDLPSLARSKGADGFVDKVDVATQEKLLSAVLSIMTATPPAIGTDNYERKLSLIERITKIVT